MNKRIEFGGFGMLDVKELDESLKLRGLGRLLKSEHPGMRLIKDNLSFEQFFFPSCKSKLDPFTTNAVALLKSDRQSMLSHWNLYRAERVFVEAIKTTRISAILSEEGLRSISYFMLRTEGKRKLGDLLDNDPMRLRRIVKNVSYVDIARALLNINLNRIELTEPIDGYPIEGRLVRLSSVTSKQIRESRSDKEPICIFKCGLIMSPIESINYMKKVKSITCTRNKNAILKYLHGDIYTNERLARFGLKDDPSCEHCGMIDTIDHRLETCPRSLAMISLLEQKTIGLRQINQIPIDDKVARIMGSYQDVDLITLTLHAEMLQYLMSRKNENPNAVITRLIKLTYKREKKKEMKEILRNLLE